MLQGQSRVLVITSSKVYLLDRESFVVKDSFSLAELKSVSCSPYNDGVLVIRTAQRVKVCPSLIDDENQLPGLLTTGIICKLYGF